MNPLLQLTQTEIIGRQTSSKESLGRLTYFKLAKLLYLTDLMLLNRLSYTSTKEIYLRQTEGPWPPSLKPALRQVNGREIESVTSRGCPIVRPGPSPRITCELDYNALNIVTEVVQKYGHLSNAKMKSTVYLTEPMK